MVAEENFVATAKLELLTELGIPVDRIVRDEQPLGYRWSSKRVIGHADDGRTGAVVGSYRPGSHDVVPMRGCLVDHPDIAACFDELETSIAGSPDGDHLRYAWAKTNGQGDVLLTLVLDCTDASAQTLAKALSIPRGVASCVQQSSGNAMRGHSLVHLCGVRALTVTICGVPVRVGPLGFLQPNPSVAARAYPDLVGARRGALAFDLYAGAGVTTHLLEQQYHEVRACESSPESATLLGIVPQTAEQFLNSQPDVPQLIVANPPRAGLGAAVCDAVIALARRSDAPLYLHVMSCEPRALARDIARLTGDGPFAFIGARAYDTLPQTAHIEVVAWLVCR